MANSSKLDPLKANDEVYVNSLGTPGSVVRARPGDINEPEEQRYYEVRITEYFLRTDLELYDAHASREKQESNLTAKMARLNKARIAIETIQAAGGDADDALIAEFASACNELLKLLKELRRKS